MAVNALTYEDIGAILGAMYAMATDGTAPAEPVKYGDFVSVAQKTLQLGTDPIMNALTQVLSKTIFAERPYDAKFRILEMDNLQWGNIVRKINFLDGAPLFPEMTYGDGFDRETLDELQVQGDAALLRYNTAANPWTGKTPAVAQTNFYGTAVAADSYRIPEVALQGAFRGPDEFAAFLSSLMTFINNRHAQFVETLARGAIANYITGQVASDEDETGDHVHVIHLLTEYNAATGQSLTPTTVYAPANFKPFMAWIYGRIASISDMMTERADLYHTELSKTIDGTKLKVLRHTPKADQKVLLYSPVQHMSAARALADTYHDSYLKYTDVELVNHFGDVLNPDHVSGSPTYLKTDGSGELVEASEDSNVGNIFGIITDRNTVGYMRQQTRVLTSPYNPSDQSYTIWWHLAGKWVNDFSENGVVMLLD